MRYIFALLLLLVSSVASAQVYKCTHGGQVAYQDSPCAKSEQAVQMHVGAESINDLLGCFSVTPQSWGPNNADFMIQVRQTDEGYQLRAIGSYWGPYSSVFKLRRANWHELDAVSESSHTHLRAGLTVQWNPDQEPAPVGIYRGMGENGKMKYIMSFRNTWGPAMKMDCP
ncbi:MAG: DUF4124 domain-containing protein [Xanthomonadaceae bacterium]|nr:DUF4124 domain-containing protein [Xanthomonadaceae bacterium]MDE2055362.1 DUF4124 domain-containing protein [Xanthomonadaceae bacterium]MDE2224479.1 DUF4124 domain-containing protein [Xanthomonadaceae bacterium]MDE2498341.1 DUF4124 domain-containing protein [Xanthomonadaceae bacterium]HJR11358.1 DUF4124 domain-containing protein [Rhodanobacteraceae bacterium]